MKNFKINLCIFISLLAIQLFSQTPQWRVLPGLPPVGGRYEDLYFINPNTGWTVEYGIIHKTTNSGESWTAYVQQGSNRSVGFFDSQTGIVGTLDTVRPMSRTTNGGVNWSLVNNFTGSYPKGICGISIVDQNTAYACGTYYTQGKVYKTTDKGLNWSIVFFDTSLARTLIDCYFWSADSGIAVGGYHTSSFISGNSAIILTTNSGNTWQRVYRSTRPNEWCWKISFYSRTSGAVSIERNGDSLSYFLKTTNGGFNWTEHPFLPYNQEGIGFINANTGWLGGYGPIVHNDSTYETTDGGLTWHIVGWMQSLNRIRFINDTLGFASGRRVAKYSRTAVGIQPVNTFIPENTNLYQNYPNPFNPITLIKFDITSGGGKPVNTKLTVYDQLGRVVRYLINEDLSPGSYRVSFDGGYFPSGIYFYKLETGKFSEVKKMVLVR